MKAKDVMTREVVSIDKDERLTTVLEMMRKSNVSKIPVTEKGRLVGLLVDGDLADELGALKNRGVATAQLHVTSAMRRQVQTASPDTPVAEVLYQMVDHDVGLVPVVHDGTIVGVVTASDLVSRVTSQAQVAQFMTRTLHVVHPHDRIIHARRLMVDHHVERLPVIEGGRVLGILGERDVALALYKFRETVPLQRQAAQLKELTVENVMRRQVVTIEETATAAEAAKRMRENDVGSLPVLRGDRIVGIVTRSDLLRLLDL